MNKVNENPGSGSWRALFRTLKMLHLPWGWIAVGLALNLGFNSLLLELPNTTASLMSGEISGSAVSKAIVYYVMLGLMSAVAVAGRVQAQAYSVRCARGRIWDKMLGLRMEFFDRNDPSDLMSAIVNDAGNAVNNFVNIIVFLIPDLYYIIMALLRINRYHWILAVSCFAMLPLKYLYALIMGRRVQVSTTRLYERIGSLTSYLADRINHLPLIKTYTNEAAEDENGKAAAHKLLEANMKLVHLDNMATAITSVIGILQKFVVVVVAVILLQQKKIDLAMWLAFFLFSQNLFPTMDSLFDTWIRIKSVHGSFRRIVEIMDGQSECRDEAKPFPEDGGISFENVSFTYPETESPALKNVSFDIPRGSSVAIVGLCGSGKTTTVSMLERFYMPDEGRVCLGGIDINELSLSDYRRHFAYVQQGADVFGGTLSEALCYGIERVISDEEIFAAAEKTGFAEYLSACPEGLEAELAPGGGSMSGGQSQRLVLTRELLRGGNIILMDEPTSALDVRVSAKIQATMNEVFAGKTKILITHDLSLARQYDRILVMSGGCLVGDGTHDSLLQSCEAYRKMNEIAGEEAEA